MLRAIVFRGGQPILPQFVGRRVDLSACCADNQTMKRLGFLYWAPFWVLLWASEGSAAQSGDGSSARLPFEGPPRRQDDLTGPWRQHTTAQNSPHNAGWTFLGQKDLDVAAGNFHGHFPGYIRARVVDDPRPAFQGGDRCLRFTLSGGRPQRQEKPPGWRLAGGYAAVYYAKPTRLKPHGAVQLTARVRWERSAQPKIEGLALGRPDVAFARLGLEWLDADGRRLPAPYGVAPLPGMALAAMDELAYPDPLMTWGEPLALEPGRHTWRPLPPVTVHKPPAEAQACRVWLLAGGSAPGCVVDFDDVVIQSKPRIMILPRAGGRRTRKVLVRVSGLDVAPRHSLRLRVYDVRGRELKLPSDQTTVTIPAGKTALSLALALPILVTGRAPVFIQVELFAQGKRERGRGRKVISRMAPLGGKAPDGPSAGTSAKTSGQETAPPASAPPSDLFFLPKSP